MAAGPAARDFASGPLPSRLQKIGSTWWIASARNGTKRRRSSGVELFFVPMSNVDHVFCREEKAADRQSEWMRRDDALAAENATERQFHVIG